METIDRTTGKACLSQHLKIEKNINILEQKIYNLADSQQTYIDILMSVITQIQENVKLKDIMAQLKSEKYGFCHQKYEETNSLLQEQYSFLENPFEVDEGVLECKCGSKRTISFSKQIRGGDEGTTVFAKCVDCGRTWNT